MTNINDDCLVGKGGRVMIFILDMGGCGIKEVSMRPECHFELKEVDF